MESFPKRSFQKQIFHPKKKKLTTHIMDLPALFHSCAPDIAPTTMAAIINVESGLNPYAIGVNRAPSLARQPSTHREAVATARWLLTNNYNIDMGLAQINVINMKLAGLTVEQVFDPCKNLALASAILKKNFTSASLTQRSPQAALRAALSAYNTGNFKSGLSNGYVQRVVTTALSPASEIRHRTIPRQNNEYSFKQKNISGSTTDKNNSWNVYTKQPPADLVF